MAALAAASAARAVDVSIVNGGFEQPVLRPGVFTAGVGIPGWQILTLSPPNAAAYTGVWEPSGYFPTQAWVGNQVGYSNGAVLSQSLGTTAKEGDRLTLSYRVIYRPGFVPVARVRLFAGQVLLGEVIETAANRPAAGGFEERRIEATVAANAPAIGQTLRLEIDTRGGGQTVVDDFRLNARAADSACPADVTDDGRVDDADFALFAQRYDEFFAQGDGLGDLDNNGVVDDDDFVIFAIAYDEFECQ